MATTSPLSGTRQTSISSATAAPLSSLLAEAARRDGNRLAVSDGIGRATWSGRPPSRLGAAAALLGVERLAAQLRRLRLPPGSRIGLCLPGGSEACLVILGIESAGLTPCLLPLAASREAIAEAIGAVGIRAVVTQARVGELRPAEMFCELAAERLGLRFLLAFGPDVPDGVVDLDRAFRDASLDGEPRPNPADGIAAEIVTFADGASGLEPFARSTTALLAAAALLLDAARVRPDDTIATCLAADDLKGLATGLVAALVSGAALECHGMPDVAALAAALRSGASRHLVAPGWAEPMLRELARDVSGPRPSIVLVHAAPVDLTAAGGLTGRVVDALAFGERALVAARRPSGAGPAFPAAISLTLGAGAELLGLRVAPDGTVELRGLAALARPLAGATASDATSAWQPSGHTATTDGARLRTVS